jgi:hypothetical protein
LRGADVLRLFALVLLFVPETLLPFFAKSKAQPFFFGPESRPLERRRNSSFKRLSDTPKILAVSLVVGNGPVIVAFIQTSPLNITSPQR